MALPQGIGWRAGKAGSSRCVPLGMQVRGAHAPRSLASDICFHRDPRRMTKNTADRTTPSSGTQGPAMPTDLLTPASRRRLLASAGLLTASLGRASGGAADALCGRPHPDLAVIAACAAFNAVERRKLDLIEGPGRIVDDAARDKALEPLTGEQQAYLDMLCTQRATTLAGHQARAISFALWDGGELTDRARASGFLEDRLLAALVRDLAGLPC